MSLPAWAVCDSLICPESWVASHLCCEFPHVHKAQLHSVCTLASWMEWSQQPENQYVMCIQYTYMYWGRPCPFTLMLKISPRQNSVIKTNQCIV